MSKASEKQHEKYSLVHDNSTLLLLPEMVEGLKIWEGGKLKLRALLDITSAREVQQIFKIQTV